MQSLKFSKSKQTGNQSIDVQEFKSTVLKESDLQRQCEEYCLYFPNIKIIRIPDAVYKIIFTNDKISKYVKGLISSFLKGLPDIIILKKYDDIYCRAVCFELKSAKGKMSQGQKNFAKIVPVIIIRSFEQFQQSLNQFLKED